MKSPINKKLEIQALLSVLMAVIGLVLLIFMITVEDEPGAIPLMMIGFGIAWYFIMRSRIRSQQV